MSTLEIKDLHVSVDTEDGAKEILKGVTLTIKDGETHAIMGPNGSGKSTLAYSVAGHPKYAITGGTVTLDGADVLAMTVDERARAGLFLAMQYPVEVPGVSVSNFLRTAKTALDGEAPKLRTWVKDVNQALEQLNLDPSFGTRSVNEGFSGGEKKRHEIAQLELLNPQIAILDETDSGLDIDALKIVAEGVNRFRGQEGRGVLLITHYTRILRYITPDFVHVFVDGKIAEEGGPELAEQLEAEGYDKYLKTGGGLTMTRQLDTASSPSWRSSARTSRSSSARSRAGSRWSTSTAPTPRRSRRSSSTRWSTTSSGTTPTSPAPCTSSARSRRRRSRPRATRWPAFINAPEPRRGGLHQERLRGAQPGRQHPGLGPGRPVHRRRATRSSSPRWSTTPTSCRGSCSPSARARRCAGSGSPTTASSTCRTSTSSSTSAPRSCR